MTLAVRSCTRMAAAKKAGILLSEPPTHIILLLNLYDESLLELDRANIDRHHQHFQDRPAVGTTRIGVTSRQARPSSQSTSHLSAPFYLMPQRSMGSRCRRKICDWRVSPQASEFDRKKQRTGVFRILRSGATMPFVIESVTRVDVEYQVLTAAIPVSI